MKTRIRVLAFDYDGCLADNDIAELLAKIREDNAAYFRSYGFVASNRQSHHIDYVNALQHGNGSCFPFIKKVCDDVGAIFEPFLLADIYGDLEDGASYK